MKPESNKFTALLGGKTITFETGKLAHQAGGAVTVRLGDTMMFAAATMSGEVRSGIDFFPLTVDYEERMYAGGRIPGSFFRREGRPTEEAILTARLTDRPLRPLFPKNLRNDVQVIMYALSADADNPIDVLGINAASAALTISDVPFGGPVGAIRIGRIHGQFVVDPTFQEQDESDLDLRIAGTRDAILMVECSANELSEEVMVAAIDFGHQSLLPLIEVQESMRAAVGKPKRDYTPFSLDPIMATEVHSRVAGTLDDIFNKGLMKNERNTEVDALRDQIVSEVAGDDESKKASTASAFDEALRTAIRTRMLEQGKRLDGRGLTDVRPIWCEVDISPRAHGSGLFTRGETQVLTMATLGTSRDAQEIDALTGMGNKRYMHHYNFPPFSTGEVRPLRGSSRREVGHGALAERALIPVIPSEADFPYTLRLVSEVFASNGSSSMASVCGSTLALMDTGVPIKAPVAGAAMGLIKEGERYVILTDILGVEDHIGDMDFKVAGTRKGITALQMDIKIKGITPTIMSQALAQARVARFSILDEMLAVLPEPRKELKPHAPRITTVQIPIDKIGAVIGPGGKVIRGIQEATGVKIDINDDGTVYIAAIDGDSARKAREMIEGLTESAVIGRIYTGKVVRIADFGAFIEILPNIDGLVHISQLDSERIEKVEDVVSMGDEITVMVTGIDPTGKIRLSRQAVLEGWSLEEAQGRDRGSKPAGGSRTGGDRRTGSDRFDRGNRSSNDRGGRSGDRGPRR